MPSLISHYKKQEIETKLKRFYSAINQAIKLSEIDNGDKSNWYYFCGEGDGTQSGEKCLAEFYNNYFKDYLKVLKTEYNTDPKGLFIYFADGSVVRLSYGGRDYTYYINNKHFDNCNQGKDCFMFAFYTNYAVGLRKDYFIGKGIEPYIHSGWDGTREGLRADARSCVKLIQINGWKIPEDYPIKF